jgi:hypothetical protein
MARCAVWQWITSGARAGVASRLLLRLRSLGLDSGPSANVARYVARESRRGLCAQGEGKANRRPRGAPIGRPRTISPTSGAREDSMVGEGLRRRVALGSGRGAPKKGVESIDDKTDTRARGYTQNAKITKAEL